MEIGERYFLDNYILRGALDSLPVAVIITDPGLVIRFVNPPFIQLTGFSPEDVKGTSAPYPWWPPAHHKEYLKELSAVKKGQKNKTDWLFAGKDGHQFWIKANVAPVIKNGQVEYIIACWTDITSNKIEEANLNNQLDLLKARGASFRLA